MGKYLFFDIDGTLISKKTIKEIKQTCKNSHKAFKCIKAPISIIKDVNNIGFNDIIASTGSFGDEFVSFLISIFLQEILIVILMVRLFERVALRKMQ